MRENALNLLARHRKYDFRMNQCEVFQFFVKIAHVFLLMYLKSVSRVEVVCLNERKNKKIAFSISWLFACKITSGYKK